jgi:nucleotide-binding universal stress UspA family protein
MATSGRGRVVVGVHGSVGSRRALNQAVSIARERGWDLELVTAWPDADEVFIHDVPGHYMVARGRAEESQGEVLATLRDRRLEVTGSVVNARPAVALLDRCVGADLLVVGASRPERELERPGVAATLSRAAPCPVVIVPARDPAPAAVPAETGRTSRHRRTRGAKVRSVATPTG